MSPARPGSTGWRRQPMEDDALARLLGIQAIERPIALFTYHPPTAQAQAPAGVWAREAAEATLAVWRRSSPRIPGWTKGGTRSSRHCRRSPRRSPDFASSRPSGGLPGRPRLGGRRRRQLVVGVIEAATLHKPAVDVGDRQRGRLRGDNVVHAEEGRAAVEAAVRLALSPRGTARRGGRQPLRHRGREPPHPRYRAERRSSRPGQAVRRRGPGDGPGGRRGGDGVTQAGAHRFDRAEHGHAPRRPARHRPERYSRLHARRRGRAARRPAHRRRPAPRHPAGHEPRGPRPRPRHDVTAHRGQAGSPRALVLDLLAALHVSAVPEVDADGTLVGLHTSPTSSVPGRCPTSRSSWPADGGAASVTSPTTRPSRS